MNYAKCRDQCIYQLRNYKCRYRKCIIILTSGNAASTEWIPEVDVIHFIFWAAVYFSKNIYFDFFFIFNKFYEFLYIKFLFLFFAYSFILLELSNLITQFGMYFTIKK